MGLYDVMKEIKLHGKVAAGRYVQVDDEDYEYLNQWKWHAWKSSSGKLYAKRTKAISVNKKQMFEGIWIHREILKISDTLIQVDHRDGNPLNNQRSNLRMATHAQNMANKGKKKNATSKYLGVCLAKRKGKAVGWQVQCNKKGNKMLSKLYKTEIEAALQYNEWAKEHHGEFANLNIIENGV